VRDVLIYCRDHRCSHSTTISADRWPDHVRLSLLASPEREIVIFVEPVAIVVAVMLMA
jgi:hypothetical protein